MDSWIKAGDAEGTISILAADLHLPNGLRWGRFGDFINGSVIVGKRRGGAFVEFDVAIC